MEATALDRDLSLIPIDWLERAYSLARCTYSTIPVTKDIRRAWYEQLKPDFDESLKRSSLDYRPTKNHQCMYCAVVAHRLGGYVPDMSDTDKSLAMGKITDDELKCFNRTIRCNQLLFDFWTKNTKSPYYGLTTIQNEHTTR